MNPLYNRVSLAALLAATAIGPGTAGASGFALLEQSASRLGTAFAGTAAAADDATTLFFNPAGMTLIEGNQLAAGLASGIEITSEFSNAGSTAAFGQPSGGTGGDAGGWNFVPGVYLTTPLTDDVTIGLGINAPFGLQLVYEDGWVGRFQAVHFVVLHHFTKGTHCASMLLPVVWHQAEIALHFRWSVERLNQLPLLCREMC